MNKLEISCKKMLQNPVYNDQGHWMPNTKKLKCTKTLMCCSSHSANNIRLNMYAKVGKPERKLA